MLHSGRFPFSCMSTSPSLGCLKTQIMSFAAATVLINFTPLVEGEDSTIGSPSSFLPERIEESTFDALKSHSPFIRTLGLSDSVVLTGMARIESEVYATLFDTDTTESHLVTESSNSEGWQLVEVKGNESDLESLTAKIQIEGGEVVSIRYEQLPEKVTRKSPGSSHRSSTSINDEQKSTARKQAINYKGENSADGYPKLPPPDVVKKLSQLSVDQRESINREMLELRNRGLGMDERKGIYNRKIDDALRRR